MGNIGSVGTDFRTHLRLNEWIEWKISIEISKWMCSKSAMVRGWKFSENFVHHWKYFKNVLYKIEYWHVNIEKYNIIEFRIRNTVIIALPFKENGLCVFPCQCLWTVTFSRVKHTNGNIWGKGITFTSVNGIITKILSMWIDLYVFCSWFPWLKRLSAITEGVIRYI